MQCIKFSVAFLMSKMNTTLEHQFKTFFHLHFSVSHFAKLGVDVTKSSHNGGNNFSLNIEKCYQEYDGIALFKWRPTLKPVGHQSTNWMVLLVLIVAIAAFTSLGTTSPRNSKQQAMYLPWRGSHLTIWLAGSKQALVISETLSCSW